MKHPTPRHAARRVLWAAPPWWSWVLALALLVSALIAGEVTR